MAKAKNPVMVSPVGIGKYVWVMKADTGFDGKSEPKFKLRLLIDDNDEARAWMAKVTETAKTFAKTAGIKLKKQFKTPFKLPEDQDEDDFAPQEGKDKPKLDEDHKDRIFFEVHSKYKPGLIDTAKPTPQPLPEGVDVRSGDKIRVKFEVVPYDGLGSGYSLRLKVVQLVEKNSSYSGGVDTSGFDEIDGYVADSSSDDDEDEQF